MKQLIACSGLDCEKGFDTCGDCKERDSCPIAGAVFQHAPGTKENLRS